MSEQQAMLDVDTINSYYDEAHVLHDVYLRVMEGETVALLGRNGAGKTTMLRSILGLTPPRTGRISFKARDITRLATHQIANLHTAVMVTAVALVLPFSVPYARLVRRLVPSRHPMPQPSFLDESQKMHVSFIQQAQPLSLGFQKVAQGTIADDDKVSMGRYLPNKRDGT